MNINKLVLPVALTLLSTVATAADVTDFAVRGVTPGADSSAACDKLADRFQDEPELREAMGIPRRSQDWMFSVDRFLRKGSESHRKGCRAGFKAYDKTIGGALVRSDHIEVKATNGQVYFVKNTQTLNVGDSIGDCTDRRTKMVSGLIDKYGKPTADRNGDKRDRTFRHIVWDYSSSPAERQGDDGHEKFEAYIQCGMYTHETNFSEMKTQVSVHSGKTIQQAREGVKSKQTFEPTL